MVIVPSAEQLSAGKQRVVTKTLISGEACRWLNGSGGMKMGTEDLGFRGWGLQGLRVVAERYIIWSIV